MENNLNYQTFELFQLVAKDFAPCMNDYLYVFDISTDTYYITEQALERFALPSSLFHNVLKAHQGFVHPADFDMLNQDLQKLTSGEKDSHDLEYRWISKDGTPIWINCKGRVIKDDSGKPKLMIGCINEIGKRQSADNVSGLKRFDSVKRIIHKAKESEHSINLLRIGIDDFKVINERLGSAYGDFILSRVGASIQRELHKDQYVYYLVSDEFMIMDFSDASKDELEDLYDRIRSSVDHEIEIENYKAFYTISGGIVCQSDTGNGLKENVKLSEYALAEAKSRGKNRVYVYNDKDYNSFLRKSYVLDQLRKSVNNNCQGFELYFQPIIVTETEDLHAAESLLRFFTSDGELIAPYEFIPLLESTGLIIPVGKWVLEEAMKTVKYVRQFKPDFKVNVNLSYVQLLKSPVFDEIMELLHTTPLPADGIIVELTESGYLDTNSAVHSVWNKLKSNGIAIAIDDFGTGYSNLYNLVELEPDIVKVDRVFTVRATKTEYDFRLLSHIIEMVHSLGLQLVIEGIETKEELDKISVLHPDYIQGYYYSKPCPKAEFYNKYLK